MSITLTRQELYNRVWAEPVHTLAKQFGLSNVGLGKACRRHNIHVPPRGYWARKTAGHTMRQPPLPPSREGDETVTLLGSPRPRWHPGGREAFLPVIRESVQRDVFSHRSRSAFRQPTYSFQRRQD
jgi:hypothetical protein